MNQLVFFIVADFQPFLSWLANVNEVQILFRFNYFCNRWGTLLLCNTLRILVIFWMRPWKPRFQVPVGVARKRTLTGKSDKC
jgi:hypothetical protein